MQSRDRKPTHKAAVLGAGVMGAQIAAHLANAGLSVDLLDLPGEGDDRDGLVTEAFTRARKLRPDPFFSASTADWITTGNFEDHLDRIADADWIIEAIVENAEAKQNLMARVEDVASHDAIISTNTSGIAMGLISQGRSESFGRRFLGTHFFNPPRYLRLLEVIPGPETDPEVVERMSAFGRLALGKGVVVAKDTPGFIGNRVGAFELMLGIHTWLEGDYTIEEIDALTGPLVGRPPSALFRTADVIGLDTLAYIVDYLHDAVDDESGSVLTVPDAMRTLVAEGAIGAKSGSGFYRKEGADILSLDMGSTAYTPAKELDLGDLSTIGRLRTSGERLRALYEDQGRAGAFARRHWHELLAYCARRLPEIADSPADVDRVMRWGFGWELGPFEIWDALGVRRVAENMSAAGVELPDWVAAVSGEEGGTFYREDGDTRAVHVPTGAYVEDPQPTDEIHLPNIGSDPQRVIWEGDSAGLLDLGDDVALYEFRSKANSLGRSVIDGLLGAIDQIEKGDFRGLVIGNEGRHFSVGANLKEFVDLTGQWDRVDDLLVAFQSMVQRIYYARKPVVVAAHGRALGGGCEVVMASPNPVADAESYIGLVELGVGLIPSAGGTMRCAVYAHEQAADGEDDQVQENLDRFLETVSAATVSGSARHAQELGFLPPHTNVVMHSDRRLYVAKQEVLRLSGAGHAPPPERCAVRVLGEAGREGFISTLDERLSSGEISEYDHHLASRLAWVMTGGDIPGTTEVHESRLLDLERETFLSLLGQERTQARIDSILTRNKPLRN